MLRPQGVRARRLGKASIKTKLLLMMLLLLALSVSSLFFLHLLNERQLLSQVRDYTEELSTTIEVAQEQPAGPGDPQVVLKAYAEKLTSAWRQGRVDRRRGRGGAGLDQPARTSASRWSAPA